MIYKQLLIFFTLILLTSFLLALFLIFIDYISDFYIQECVYDLYYTLSNESLSDEVFEDKDSLIFNLKCNKNSNSPIFLKNIIIIKQIKTDIEKQTKFIIHKIKLYNRTLSWFFKGSKPGGGRGL
jgi:hypothetical protein